MAHVVDPITFEVIRSLVDSIADQMSLALTRSAYSGIVRDSLDYSTAVCDGKGRMVAQGLASPLHLGSFPNALRHLIARYGERTYPGDVFILNDPYGSGGIHLPDLYVIKPIFVDGAVEGYAMSLAHHTDVGGIVPGSNSVHSTEIYQEGLRVPLLKLYERGEPNVALFKIVEANVRVPVMVLGDLRAQVSAAHTGEQAFLEAVRKHGVEAMRVYLEEMQDHTERLARAEIAALPDGVYEFTDCIDGLGEHPEPIVFHVQVTIAGDRMRVDWTGSSPQVKAGLNSPMSYTQSATYAAVRSVMRQNLPNCEGYMRPIEVVAPLGTITNPVLPGACGARGLTGYRMIDTVLGALAQALPDLVPAACEGGATIPSIGGYQHGKPFVYVETVLGAWGGRPNRDGAEGVSNLGANVSNQPVELIEAELPLEVTRYGFRPDSGGVGKHRGGLSLVREYRLMADEAILAIRSDRRSHPPYGLQGGGAGTPSSNVLNPGPAQRVLPALPMEAIPIRRGDVYRHHLSGGGGWGDPLERDPRATLEDVLDEKMTIAHARSAYGIVIDPSTLALDLPATERVREEMGRARSCQRIAAQ
ncbi:MAG: hydantoinase B/oxoprolinase family protein [Chloroflexi bacterium]|nr:hydantoinase B/oxoprolinase family protein [Chloroflexota bacterium]